MREMRKVMMRVVKDLSLMEATVIILSQRMGLIFLFFIAPMLDGDIYSSNEKSEI